jgi:tripartite-type tricarboxylate transporter receptor subunit TctC
LITGICNTLKTREGEIMKRTVGRSGAVWIGLMILASICLSSHFSNVQAQNFPTKPITVIIPFGPGGSSDLTFRAITTSAQQFLGQPIVIEVKPGGGGAIGSELVARAKPDGYTLLAGHSSVNSILPAFEGRSNGPDSLEPVCRINWDYGFVVTRVDAPFKTYKEMIEWAKAHPGELKFGHTGVMGIVDLAWRVAERHFGMKTKSVPFEGGGQALTALLGGHIDVTDTSPSQTLAQIKAGKIIALAWDGPARHPDLPNVPTAKEAGFVTDVAGVWKGVLAPKGTPKPIIDKLAQAFKQMTETEQAKASVKQLGNWFDYAGPEEFGKSWKAEYQWYVEFAKTIKK